MKDIVEDVFKVFLHGANKHETIPDFEENIKHAVTHWKLSFGVALDQESGLPHKAHCIARLLLAILTSGSAEEMEYIAPIVGKYVGSIRIGESL